MHSSKKKVIKQNINTCSLIHREKRFRGKLERVSPGSSSGICAREGSWCPRRTPCPSQETSQVSSAGNAQLSEIFHKRHHKKHSFIISPLTVLRICSYLQFSVKESWVLALFLGTHKCEKWIWDFGFPFFSFFLNPMSELDYKIELEIK